MISLTFLLVNVRLYSLTEQVGQEILANLHSDREKIQRARERVSTYMPAEHTHLFILTSVCETVKVLPQVSNHEGTDHFLQCLQTQTWHTCTHTHTHSLQ